LTPNAAQGDFFETADAFFSGDLQWALAALKRHFFAGGDARPVLAALQNRNRILIQVRALSDAGDARVGPRGVDGLQRAAEAYGPKFGEAAARRARTTSSPRIPGTWASSPERPPCPPSPPDRQPEGVHPGLRGDHPQAGRPGGGPARHDGALLVA